MTNEERLSKTLSSIVSLIFTNSVNDIYELRKTLYNVEDNLYIDLINNTNMAVKLLPSIEIFIRDNFIKYCTDVIDKSSDFSVTDKTICNLASLQTRCSTRLNGLTDNVLSGKIQEVNSIVSNLSSYQVNKIEELKEVILNKVLETKNDIKSRIQKIEIINNKIKDSIIDTEILIDCCDFLVYYFSRNNIKNDDMAPLTVNTDYLTALSEITNIYMSWKGVI